MSSYLQIQGDPTKWWPVQPVQASQLTGPVMSVPIKAPLVGTLLISARAASVAVFNTVFDPEGVVPSDVAVPMPTIYVPSAAGPTVGSTGYQLPLNTDLASLATQITALMQGGESQAITLGGAASGGELVLNGATLPFVVLCGVSTQGALGQASGGGPVPSDR